MDIDSILYETLEILSNVSDDQDSSYTVSVTNEQQFRFS